MQALRTLPILNRPSRPSSPAPPSTHVTHVNGTTQQPSLPANGELKARSRSLSRHLSGAYTAVSTSDMPPPGTVPAPANGMNGAKAPSPPLSRVATPRQSAAPLPADMSGTGQGTVAPATGYMDVLGLRLNEVVNKATAGIDYKHKKGFKKGCGWQVGEAIVKEMPYPPNDAYLIRAVLRTAVKSLSIYITRLESLLLPALTDPAFAAALNTTHVTATSNPLNPAQMFAVSVAHTAWETCEVLEQTLETGKWPKFVSETLRPVMDKLDLVVGKVVQPLLIALKRDLVASLSRSEGVSPPGGKVLGLSSVPHPIAAGGAGTTGVPVTKEHSNTPMSRLSKEPSDRGHARGAAPTLAIPTCLQYFATRVDGARKVLETIAAPCADDGEGWITNVVVAVVWKGMCVFSEKEWAVQGGQARPPSPGSVSKALHSLGKEKDTTPSVLSGTAGNGEKEAQMHGPIHRTPSMPLQTSLSGVAKLANPLSILPSRSASRAPSPPRANKGDEATHALLSLEGLVKRLVNGLVQPPLAPGQVVDANGNVVTEEEHLAREALSEALEALTSMRIAVAAMRGHVSAVSAAPVSAASTSAAVSATGNVTGGAGVTSKEGSIRLLHALRRIRDDIDLAEEEALDDALEDMPAITLWTLLLRQANAALASLPALLALSNGTQTQTQLIRHPAELWGWSKADYDRSILNGFGSAEESARKVALVLKPEVERVLALLVKGVGEKPGKEVMGAVEWVRALGVGLDARAGVKVGGC